MLNLKVVVDFKGELDRLSKEVDKIKNNSVAERTQFATEALARVTPVKSGYARSRWSYTLTTDEKGNVVGNIDNDAPYIGKLNAGWSTQAPPFFIEQVLIAIGELSAPVVDYIDEKQ
jgi:hypothetical protein